jgi:hypothetical protein
MINRTLERRLKQVEGLLRPAAQHQIRVRVNFVEPGTMAIVGGLIIEDGQNETMVRAWPGAAAPDDPR